MSKKIKTNEDYLKALFNNLTTIEAALLRERIQKIADITREDIEGGNRKAYNNPIITANDWLRLCDKIDLHLEFKEKA